MSRDYYNEARTNLRNQIPRLHGEGILYSCVDYKDISIPGKALIYCDPPYKNTKKYNTSRNFNYEEFWNWVRIISKDNIVIVSEQQAPDDFECIWEQKVTRTIDNASRIKVTEKLFKHKDK